MSFATLKKIIGFSMIAGVIFSCKSNQKIAAPAENITAQSGWDLWYFSGFFNHEKNNNRYSLSYLVYNKAINSGATATTSFHIAVANTDSGNYIYRIFTPGISENKNSVFSDNPDIYFRNDDRILHLKKEKRNYLLQASSEKEKPEVSLYCYRDKKDTVNIFCSPIPDREITHSVSFFRKTKGTLDFGEEKIKVSGEMFYNRLHTSNDLMESKEKKYLLNFQIDSTGEFYTLIFTDNPSNPESFNILSLCSNKQTFNKMDIQIKPTGFWESPKLKKSYPISWEIKIPAANVNLNLTAVIENQEIQWMKNSYWLGSYWVTSLADSTKKIGKATAIIF